MDERTAVAQKALFVGIKDRHERYLGQVEALTKQVDAHKDVDLALAQCPQDLDAVQRRRIRMHVVDLDACIEQIVGQILGHTLGQGRNERALFAGATHLDLVEQIIDLPAYRSHVDFWIEQARRANDLLNIVLTHAQLIVARGGAHVDELRNTRLELIETQRTVIERARKPESMFNERHLT